MIFLGAFGIAATLLGYSCFTLRITPYRSMLISHFITYYLSGLAALYFLDTDYKLNLLIAGLGVLGGGAWYCIVKLFQQIEERFGRNEGPSDREVSHSK